ncbi:hypothetical protein GCM10022221_08110 [Actinocorallia aurea]
MLPDTPYSLWVGGELENYLHLPEDFRVEIIGGEIVLSRAPGFGHNHIVGTIAHFFSVARGVDGELPWKWQSGGGVDLVGVGEGYILDLVVMDAQVYDEALHSGVRLLVADQIEMAVEVTSPSNAARDRRVRAGAAQRSKWAGYARAEVPYYLVVDRDPNVARTMLYSVPDSSTGAYLEEESWDFGKPVTLPEHFGVTLPTDEWLPWTAGDLPRD